MQVRLARGRDMPATLSHFDQPPLARLPATHWHLRPGHCVTITPRFRTSMSVARSQVSLLTQADPPAAVAGPHDLAHAAAQAAPKAKDTCPSTLPEALAVFFTTPSVLFALSVIGACTGARLQLGAFSWTDAAVFLATSAMWMLQEWAIHKYLLHSPVDWFGSRIHVAHHKEPYHQVVVDGLRTVAPFMIASGALFWALLKDAGMEVVLSACVGYHLTGLFSYQFVHFLVHTRWVPTNKYLRAIRQHHMLHHMRNHDYWFAFSLPQVDALLGTAPSHPSKVPLNTVMRAEHHTLRGPSTDLSASDASHSDTSDSVGRTEKVTVA